MSLHKLLFEDYNRWQQTEQNDSAKVDSMIYNLNDRFGRIDELSPEEIWTLVRDLGYLNHSAYKIIGPKYAEFPDEYLSDEDKTMNDKIYAAKNRMLIDLVRYYVKNGLKVSMNPERTMILFRDPVNDIRQITFHFKTKDFNKSDWAVLDTIKDNTGEWSGVKLAHRYADDDEYSRNIPTPENSLPDYETWEAQQQREISYDHMRNLDKKGNHIPVWRIGKNIVLDSNGHASSHMSSSLIRAALELVDFDALTEKNSEIVVDFGKNIGYCTCVETDPTDNIIYLQRDLRRGKTRFVLDRQPSPCSKIFIVLSGGRDNKYILRTAYIGTKSGLEPWDNHAKYEDAMFWKDHALIAPEGYDEIDDLGDDGYWGRFEKFIHPEKFESGVAEGEMCAADYMMLDESQIMDIVSESVMRILTESDINLHAGEPRYVVTVDFDGTVVEHAYPRIGKDVGAVPVLKKIVASGGAIILDTMRGTDTDHGDTLTPAVNWFKKNGIPLWGVQSNPDQKWTNSTKIHARLSIDDRNAGAPLIDGHIDWKKVEKYLIQHGFIRADKGYQMSEDDLMRDLREKIDEWTADVYEYASDNDNLMEITSKLMGLVYSDDDLFDPELFNEFSLDVEK